LSNTNSTELRFTQQHDKSAEIQNNNIAQRKNENLLAERKSTLEKHCEYMRACRKNESSEQREKRLAKNRSYKKLSNKTNDESVEERKSRLEKQRECKRARRKNESSEQQEKRLAKNRSYKQLSKSINEESVEERKSRLDKQREYTRARRKNETSEQREKRLAKNRLYKKLPKNNDSLMTQLIRDFHSSISSGPLYVCTCCDQLWYKHSLCPADRIRLVNPDIVKYLQNIKSVDNVEWLCNTCSNHLRKGKVPPCAIAKGMKFPEKPAFFDLNELECRLIAPRLAFQKIFQAPRGGQLKIMGNVVNVPADVNNTVNMLPRLPHETGTIKVQLKRRLQYKSSALSLNIRPHKVMQAAAWLVNTSSLYQEQGITLDQTWLTSIELETVSDNLCNENTNISSNNLDTPEDEWSEVEAEIPAGVTDSMLTPPDFVADSERQEIYNFAPAEGNKPLSIFRDQYSEEMAYPGIFLGQKRTDDKQRLKSVYYCEICKSELRRSD
jgi:hypothetical protein